MVSRTSLNAYGNQGFSDNFERREELCCDGRKVLRYAGTGNSEQLDAVGRSDIAAYRKSLETGIQTIVIDDPLEELSPEELAYKIEVINKWFRKLELVFENSKNSILVFP